MSRMKLTITVIAAALLMTTAAGCAQAAPDPPAGPGSSMLASSGPSRLATPQPTGTGQAVPESLRFTATTVDGEPFDAADLSGKPVVLWFWAAWCPRCRAAAAQVAAVQRENAATVQVIGVAGLRSGQANMARFVADTGVGGFPHLADDRGVVWQKFGVTTQEYYVLIDAAGQVVHKGPLTRDELRGRVADLTG